MATRRATPEQTRKLFGQQRDWNVSLSPTQPYKQGTAPDEDKPLMDEHVKERERFETAMGFDAHVQCWERHKKRKPSSNFKKGSDLKGMII